MSGCLIGSQASNKEPLPSPAELAWWYQFYFATERGRAGYEQNRREFARLIWHTASPARDFDDATFERSAASFDNEDHVDIHNYRWRLGLAEGEPRYEDLERRLAEGPSSACRRSPSKATRTEHLTPTRAPTRPSSRACTSTARSRIGHNLAQEAPAAFADGIVDVATS